MSVQMRNDGQTLASFDDLPAQIFMLRLAAYGALGWRYQSSGARPTALNALRAYGMLFSRLGLLRVTARLAAKPMTGRYFHSQM